MTHFDTLILYLMDTYTDTVLHIPIVVHIVLHPSHWYKYLYMSLTSRYVCLLTNLTFHGT